MTKQPLPGMATATAALVLSLGACSPGTQVHTQVAPEAIQERPTTVSVKAAAEYVGGRTPYEYSPLLDDAATSQALRADLARGLARRGYVVSDAAPDATLVYYLALPEQHDFTDADYDFTWRPAWWRGWASAGNDASQEEYADGALMIDLVDARTGEVLWREHAETPVPGHERAYERVLGRSVAAMLSRLPARPAGNSQPGRTTRPGGRPSCRRLPRRAGCPPQGLVIEGQ